ncbi:MAG: hypothetical protein PVI21_04285 [Candidatus Woesebacteria bacterium]
MQEQKLTGVKKRQQIESASRTMFIWVAAASVAVSVAIVVSQFFIQKLVYNNKVISAKSLAADTLKKNIQNAEILKQGVDALVGNQDLASVKTNPDDSNTKIVLDALPSVNDPTALATSLQQAILSKSGVTIENITVPSVIADDATATETASVPVEQIFSVTVSGSYDKINDMILDLERTIRPMKITEINLNGNDASMRAVVSGVTYYQPAKTTSIKEETVEQ